MHIAQLFQRLAGKQVVDDLGLLKAKHIGRFLPQQIKHDAETQPDGIDIPGRDFHARVSASMAAGA